MTNDLINREMDSPVGVLTLQASPDGLRSVFWGSNEDAPIADEGGDSDAVSVLNSAQLQLEQYFAGERQDFDVPLDPREIARAHV